MKDRLVINERWSLAKDKTDQWILYEHYMGKDKDGNPKPKEREKYFPWAWDATNYAANHSCQGKSSIRKVEKVFHELADDIRGCTRTLAAKVGPLFDKIHELETALTRAEKQRERNP